MLPNVTELMKRKGYNDYEVFRKAVLHATGVSFCTHRHFGRPLPGEQQFYIRLAYSGIKSRYRGRIEQVQGLGGEREIGFGRVGVLTHRDCPRPK